jgi:hypothetical protein
MTAPASGSSYRLELILRKPRLGWFPRPTVVLDGRGQPAQWGTGTWQVSTERDTTIEVFLFNRLWRFGAAKMVIGETRPSSLVYSAPWLPFRPGKFSG